MGEIFLLLGWAFKGKADSYAGRLVQWWVRITALWIALLGLVVLCAAISVAFRPQLGNALGAYLTLEAAALLAMVGPLLLAVVLFLAYFVIRTLIFVGLVIATMLGVIG
jgi:hypothetical protein